MVGTVSVGEGPVSMSILEDKSSVLWILTTSFNDDTYTITR